MLSFLCTLQITTGRVWDRVTARLRDEEGASTVEWVVITGFLIVVAGFVGRFIYNLVVEGTRDIDLPKAPSNP